MFSRLLDKFSNDTKKAMRIMYLGNENRYVAIGNYLIVKEEINKIGADVENIQSILDHNWPSIDEFDRIVLQKKSLENTRSIISVFISQLIPEYAGYCDMLTENCQCILVKRDRQCLFVGHLFIDPVCDQENDLLFDISYTMVKLNLPDAEKD